MIILGRAKPESDGITIISEYLVSRALSVSYRKESNRVIARQYAESALKGSKINLNQWRSIISETSYFVGVEKTSDESNQEFLERYLGTLGIPIPKDIDLSAIEGNKQGSIQ